MRTNINKQQEILDFIEQHTKERGYPPTVREICAAVGLNSPSTVHGYLSRLEKAGKILRDPTNSRGIRLAPSNKAHETEVDKSTVLEVPVIGTVSAGMPITAEENIERTFPLPLDFARGSDVFMLRVRGDSMIQVGILNGDYVIVKSQPTASNGEIVAALVDDSATIKTFYKEAGHFRLQPENDLLEPIILDTVSILGKVIGVYRIL